MPEVQVKFGLVRRYLPAVLKENTNGWHIEYYAMNEITRKLERKRVKLNRERKKSRTFMEFRSIATEMIMQINCQLAAGWSPFAVQPTQQLCMLPSYQVQPTPPPAFMQSPANKHEPKKQEVDDGSIPMLLMLDKFIQSKSRDLTENTLRSYKSFCNGLRKWLKENHPDLRSNEFTKRFAVEYMDYVLEGNNAFNKKQLRKHDDGSVCNSTYNNNLKQGRALFSWAVEKCYCTENPFESIKVKREEKKSRVLIPAEWRSKIREYFEKNNPQYLIICELVHTSLIRPAEISRLQVKMINLEEGYIQLPSDITKNHKERRARLSAELKRMLAEHIDGAQESDYLFADQCWRCGKKPISSHTYGKKWEAMRKVVKLPSEMQLYSLRDTGINGMLKAGIDPLSVMQAADHHDLSMTTRYANHADPELFRKLNELAPSF